MYPKKLMNSLNITKKEYSVSLFIEQFFFQFATIFWHYFYAKSMLLAFFI